VRATRHSPLPPGRRPPGTAATKAAWRGQRREEVLATGHERFSGIRSSSAAGGGAARKNKAAKKDLPPAAAGSPPLVSECNELVCLNNARGLGS